MVTLDSKAAAQFDTLEEFVCVRPDGLDRRSLRKVQMRLLEALTAVRSPLPITVALELLALCYPRNAMHGARRTRRGWTSWYRQVWQPWLRHGEGRAVTHDEIYSRAQEACAAMAAAMIARGTPTPSTLDAGWEKRLRDAVHDLLCDDVDSRREAASWRLLNRMVEEGGALEDLIGAGHAASLLTARSEWLPDPVFVHRVLALVRNAESVRQLDAPSRRGASASPEHAPAEIGAFEELAAVRLPNNPARLVPSELLFLTVDSALFVHRATTQGLLARLGHRQSLHSRRPKVEFVFDLLVDENDSTRGADGLRQISLLREALFLTACAVVNAIDPGCADVGLYFGLDAPWSTGWQGRAHLDQGALHGRLHDRDVLLHKMLMPLWHLWTDLPGVVDPEADAVVGEDADLVVLVRFATRAKARLREPDRCRVHRATIDPTGIWDLDGMEMEGSRNNAELAARLAAGLIHGRLVTRGAHAS